MIRCQHRYKNTLTPNTTYFIFSKCWKAAWVILVDIFGKRTKQKLQPFEWKRVKKHGFFCARQAWKSYNEGKAKAKKRERGGRSEEKKAMFALLVITLEPLLWDTSIQRTQHLFRKKCSHNLCTCYLYWRDTSFGGKGHFFWVSKAGFNLPSGNTLVLKKRLTTKRFDKSHFSLFKMASDFIEWAISLKSQHHRHNYVIIVLHFLAAWSNDCSTFWGKIKEKCIICWLIIYKLPLNLNSGDTCLGRAGVPLIKDV